MIRIAISQVAFDAIARTLPLELRGFSRTRSTSGSDA